MMDMQKTGTFLKCLRKEKGLTQEQLAEALHVAGRTVSRWETASNMPDLSMLIEIAAFFDVEVKEILNGERSTTPMEQELKDTLKKVADYNRAELEKRVSVFVTAFLLMIIIGILALNIQLLLFSDLRYIIGEAVILLTGSIAALILTVKNGLWVNADRKTAVKKDAFAAGVTAALFSCFAALLIFNFTDDAHAAVTGAVSFFFIVYILGFSLLRLLAFRSSKKRRQSPTDHAS